MREVTRIVTAALAAAALSLAAAMPLVAAWRMPAEHSATQASTDAPGQQIQGLPRTDAASHCASARHRMIIFPSHYERC
jgi:hypothetical protein